MIRMKENYYIKKYYGDFEACFIKEMIKDEVNHRKTEPLYKLILLMRQMYNRFYEENMECCFVG